jgi:hypothetical protein
MLRKMIGIGLKDQGKNNPSITYFNFFPYIAFQIVAKLLDLHMISRILQILLAFSKV